MIKENIYIYIGINGSITSPVLLENVPKMQKVKLTAEKGKILTNGIVKLDTVIVPVENEKIWKEIDKEPEGQE